MNRPLLIAIAGLLVIAVAIGLSIDMDGSGGEADEASASVAADLQSAPDAATGEAPSFDVVRINPEGNAVIAGRAEPKAEVVILDLGAKTGSQEIGRTIADNRGEWVFLPDMPLPPGSRELTLRAANPDGSVKMAERPVVLVVPGRVEEGPPLAVRVAPGAASQVLQGPDAGVGAGSVSIGVVTYDDAGALTLAGRGEPGSEVRLYLDNKFLGGVQTDGAGNWRLVPRIRPAAKESLLRADQVTPQGKVAARVEIPFSLQKVSSAGGDLVIEPGHSLWRIARRSYGSGFDYSVIYRADRDQIRDPDKIYPGQVMQLPAH